MLVLVRHGESAANAAGVLSGRTESPLTDRGKAQVAAVSAVLGTVSRLISSPLGRARASAEGLGLDLPVEVDHRWNEVDYGAFDGLALSALPADLWRRWRADASFRPPGGESLSDVGKRVRDACRELFTCPGQGASAEGDVVVVSHVSPIKAAVAWALDVGDEVAWRLQLSTGSITRVAWGDSGPVLHGFNDVPRS